MKNLLYKKHNQLPKVKLFFFTGIDGSGKTTQAMLLTRKFHAESFSVKYVWMRWFAFFSYPLLLVCRFLGYTKRFKGTLIQREYYRNRAVAHLWLNLLLLDYALYVVCNRLSERNTILVVDRFIIDILIDAMYDTHLNPFKSVLGRFLLLYLCRSLMNGVHGFLMSVDEKTALGRRSDLPSKDYLSFRIPMYLKLARYLNLTIVNGARDAQENHKFILEHFNSACLQ